MLKDKTTYLILFLVIVLFALVLSRVFLQRPSTTENSQTSQQQLPRSDFFVMSNSLSNQPIGVTDKFDLTFSKSLDPDSLEYSINPDLALEFSLDNSGVILSIGPKQIWSFDTEYKLTINSETKSKDGEKLDSDVIINFRTAPYSGI